MRSTDVTSYAKMNRPTGGRGQRMPYESMVIRIPIPCWQQVDDFCMHYREHMKLSGFSNLEAIKLNAIAKIIYEYKMQLKSGDDSTKCNELIQKLEEKMEGA